MEKNNLQDIRNKLNNYNDILTKEYINELFEIISNGETTIHYTTKYNKEVTAFIPGYDKIFVNIEKLEKWFNTMKDYYFTKYNLISDDFSKYLLLFVLKHELQHYEDYLISKGDKTPPLSFLKQVYRDLFSILETKNNLAVNPITDITKFIRLLLYDKRHDLYYLERNANIAAYNLLMQIAENEKKLYNIFQSNRNMMLKIGYQNSSIGSIHETYHDLFMEKRYKKLCIPDNLVIQDKVRYGLEVNEDIRKLILSQK